MLESWQTQIQKTQSILGQLCVHHIEAGVLQQTTIAQSIQAENGVLLTEWIAPSNNPNTKKTEWYTLYLLPEKGLCCVHSTLHSKFPALADLSHYFPVANRLQRAIRELTRIPTKKATDKRSWLNHGHFPIGVLNEERRFKPAHTTVYPFKRVSGDGVHEIPVGPVHAGIIEPGHFRFSVVGERILKLEARLGYTHKGIHQLLKNQTLEHASKLIGRISGDSTVAYACAFAMACEHALNDKVNPKIMLYRAILLERERLANHIGDIGAIINDAGLPSLQSSFNLLKEILLRHNAYYTNHRYLMDCIAPLASATVLSTDNLKMMKAELTNFENRLNELQQICDTHYGLQDRLVNTGILTTETAKKLGIIGLASKASGIDLDIRRLYPYYPYDTCVVTKSLISTADVAARVAIRFKESFESITLIRQFIEEWYSQHKKNSKPENPLTKGLGFGCVEGWRGPISVIVSINDHRINWCHFHDPSWQNWLAVEYAVLDNIVADFPLINKSFNLSYSGQDS